MRVAITGAGGQLGRDLAAVFSADHEVFAWGSTDLDISDAAAVRSAIDAIRPDLVVNAAAYTNVDACEQDDAEAWRVNAAGPWFLARASAANHAALVHISTDYVFDGTAESAYTELDPTSPISVYGRTKVAGERLVREALDEHYLVRTSWLQGRFGPNFVRTMLRLARERGQVCVVDDQHGSPSFTCDVARAIADLVETGVYGTYHRTNTGECTWFELAAATLELARVPVTLRPITTEAYNAPAPRPRYSVLDNRKSVLLGLPELPHWHDGLERLLADVA